MFKRELGLLESRNKRAKKQRDKQARYIYICSRENMAQRAKTNYHALRETLNCMGELNWEIEWGNKREWNNGLSGSLSFPSVRLTSFSRR